MVEHQPREASPLEQLSAHKFEVERFSAGSVDLKFRSPMLLPFGEISHRPSGVLNIEINIGGKIYAGGGEGATLSSPLFTDDYGIVIGEAIEEIVKDISGKDSSFKETVDMIQSYRFKNGKRFPTARMTVEMALIDALAKSTGQNVAEMLGVVGDDREVPFGKSIGGRTYEETLSEVDRAVDMNAKKVKLKISPSNSDQILKALREIRGRYSDIELMVDANGTFDPSNTDHINVLKQLDQQGLLMIEEPVSRVGEVKGINAVRMLKGKIPEFDTAICLDDCLSDKETTLSALDEDLCDVVNIKPGRIGSIVSSIEIASLCKRMRKEIMVGGMFEATPGRIMTTTLAGYFKTLGFRIPGDLSLAQDRLLEDIVPVKQQLHIGPRGGIVLPNSSGWGFEIQERPAI